VIITRSSGATEPGACEGYGIASVDGVSADGCFGDFVDFIRTWEDAKAGRGSKA